MWERAKNSERGKHTDVRLYTRQSYIKYQPPPFENIGKLFPNLFCLVCLPRRAAHKAAWIVCFLFALMKISFGSTSVDPPAACCFWLWLINNYTRRGSCMPPAAESTHEQKAPLCVVIFSSFCSRPRHESRFQLIIDQSPFVSVLGTSSKGFRTLELCVFRPLRWATTTWCYIHKLHFASLPLLNKIADELNAVAGSCVPVLV